jgi:hypothetical protein
MIAAIATPHPIFAGVGYIAFTRLHLSAYKPRAARGIPYFADRRGHDVAFTPRPVVAPPRAGAGIDRPPGRR